MNKPHKHAAIIKAWADGAVIECSYGDGVWGRCLVVPSWRNDVQYRVQPPPPHKWQKEMDAQAAGKAIQYRGIPGRGEWIDAPDAGWKFDSPTAEYRIKPETVVQWWHFGLSMHRGMPTGLPEGANLKLTFEGEELVSAEVIS